MNVFEYVWIFLLAIGAMFEVFALIDKRPGDTLSENIRSWFRVQDPRPTAFTWILRALLMISLLWFIPHIFFNWPW